MKFYKRFPGDINIKTGHLDPAEFGCYDRLLDHYYATEAPIPADGAYSICRAVKPEHRRACDKVLRQFFVQTPEGDWMQPRADEEIADALPRIEAARENGKKGGRPKKTAAGSEQKPTGFFSETQDEPGAKTSQSQSSSPSSKKVSKASPSHPPAGGKGARFLEFWQAWPKNERKQDRTKCWEHWRAKDLDAIADAILADVRVKRGTTKWQEGYIEAPLVYLRNKRWEDGVEPDGGNPGDAVSDWWETRAGCERKAKELGMGRWEETEPFSQYRQRIRAAAAAKEGETTCNT